MSDSTDYYSTEQLKALSKGTGKIMETVEICWFCTNPATVTNGISSACDSCVNARGFVVESGFSWDDAYAKANLFWDTKMGDDERTGAKLELFATEVARVMHSSEILSYQFNDKDCLEYLQILINNLLDPRMEG